ncbi:MAG: hypothetical protein ACOZIN_08585 [Myxococcota bacterium]
MLTALLKDAYAEVETSLSPPVRVPLADDGSPPSPLVRLLRPRVRILKGGVELARIQPAGAPGPEGGPRWGLVLAVSAGVLVLGAVAWGVLR